MLPPRSERFEGPLPMTEIDGAPGEVVPLRLRRDLGPRATRAASSRTRSTSSEDTTQLGAQVACSASALWQYLGGAGLILLLLQVLVLRWSLRPLRRVIDELKRVQRGQASRMSERHPRELEPLTESINAFIESERENLDRQRNTLADLAHSLKTPLAVLRARLDDGTLPKPSCARRSTPAAAHGRPGVLPAGARGLGRACAVRRADCRSSRMPSRSCAAWKRSTRPRACCANSRSAPGAQFHGEPGDLQELLGNLLENAFKWARSRVLLTVRPGRGEGNRRPGLLMAVDDEARASPRRRSRMILQRGVRGDERVQGHGIGLAIVQDIVRGYRGELQVCRVGGAGRRAFRGAVAAGACEGRDS